jgi:hypothetical protein
MRIQTILNRVEKFKSFVYSGTSLEEQDDGPAPVIFGYVAGHIIPLTRIIRAKQLSKQRDLRTRLRCCIKAP